MSFVTEFFNSFVSNKNDISKKSFAEKREMVLERQESAEQKYDRVFRPREIVNANAQARKFFGLKR